MAPRPTPTSSTSTGTGAPTESKLTLDDRLAERLRQKKALLDQYLPLPKEVVGQLGQDIRLIATFNSNAIEGNTLTLHETKLVIEEGLTIGGHNLREHLEATNHAEAFERLVKLVNTAEPITVETILELHALVLDKISETAGRFRTRYVHITGAQIEPPPPKQIIALMNEWVSWVQSAENRQKYHPVMRAAIAHHGFEAVHPFEDGNGRTGRLLLNFLLLRDGYTPALILKDWRGSYIAALRNGDSGNYRPLGNLVGRAVESSLDMYLEAANQFPNELLQPLTEVARTNGYDVNYLGYLIRQGQLEATKRRGRWYITSEALSRYREQAQAGLARRGRPRKNTTPPPPHQIQCD